MSRQEQASGLGEAVDPGIVARRLYESFMVGDLETVAGLLAGDVVFHVPGTGVNAGDYHGRDGVLAFFAQASRLTGGTLRIELRNVLVGDTYAAAVATYRATRPNRVQLENNLVHLMRFEDGRIVESWFHSRNQYEVDEFWAKESVAAPQEGRNG
jgi:ketosteroid isomerase-like protein